MVIVTDERTGEIFKIEGDLMIASNGRAFIKCKGKTVFSSGSLDYTFETK